MQNLYRMPFYILTLTAVAACSPKESGSFTFYVSIPFLDSQCLKIVETKGSFKNGTGLITTYNFSRQKLKENIFNAFNAKESNTSRLPSDVIREGLTWHSEYFVEQRDQKSCWAAAIEMALKYSGQNRSQQEFLAANERYCGILSTSSATLNQIIFSITSVYANEGIWIADPYGQFKAASDAQFATFAANKILGSLIARNALLPTVPAVSPLNGFSQINWSTHQKDGSEKQGGIFPISNSVDLVFAMKEKSPVIAGIEINGEMHVVLITSVNYRPGGAKIEQELVPYSFDPKIESVFFVDPITDGSIRSINGGKFSESLHFAFKIIP